MKNILNTPTHQLFVAVESLPGVKASKIIGIKAEADKRISALDKLLRRSERHTALGKPQKKARNVVLQDQQDIEEASDVAEIAVQALTTIEAVKAFTW